jgi:hypothetical protein
MTSLLHDFAHHEKVCRVYLWWFLQGFAGVKEIIKLRSAY